MPNERLGDLLAGIGGSTNRTFTDAITWTGVHTHSGAVTFSGNLTVPNDNLLGIGTGNIARFSWETIDANANELLLQLPAGGAVNVPVIVIGQAIEDVDLGLYNGVVDPRIAIFGIGAVTTAPVIEFRKARGTVAAPTVLTTGDDLGTLDFYGAVAAGEYVRAASIRADMAGTIATTRGPGTLTFMTATDAAPSVLTTALTLGADQTVTVGSHLIIPNDVRVSFGGATAPVKILWETADANANELLFELPAGGAVNVPVAVYGIGIENIDLGMFNGVTTPTLAFVNAGATAIGSGISFRKARGTHAAPTASLSGDDIGEINFYGAVAAGEFVQSARIFAELSGTIATTRGPGAIYFQTATDAAPSVMTTVLSLDQTQTVGMPNGLLSLGTAGSKLGTLSISGNTSGTVGLTVAAAAGTWTMTLPTAVGTAGFQLTDAAGNGITSWTAAGSLPAYKNIVGLANSRANEALARMISANVYDFHYKSGMGTGDVDTLYTGVMATEYPEVMHYSGGVVNPINVFGETVLAMKALVRRIEDLESR